MKITRRNILKLGGAGLLTLCSSIPNVLASTPKNRNFALRGLKGWAWTPEQYLEEIPHMKAMNLNFLMNCYLSMFDFERGLWRDKRINRWWNPLSADKKLAYEKIVRACQTHDIEFCFSMHPNVFSERFADPFVSADVDALWQHYTWMQSLGVKWFSIAMDDIGARGSDPTMQAFLVNSIYHRLRAKDGQANMIFCSSWYWGDGNDDGKSYLQTINKSLDPDIYVFWTGDSSITPKITRKAAESYKAAVGHKLFIWDNYPCNDDAPTMHLGPLTGREPDLCEVAEGYMSNSMCKQNRLNRLPLATCADYAYDPYNYDPNHSLRLAITNLSDHPWQANTLRDMVENYPSNLLLGKNQLSNPVRERLENDLRDGWSMADVEWLPGWIETLAFQLTSNFNGYYKAEYDTMMADVEWLRRKLYENRKYVRP